MDTLLALQKDNAAKLTIDNSPNTTGELIAISSSIIISASDTTTGILRASGEYGAGIGSGSDRSCSSITINGGSVDC